MNHEELKDFLDFKAAQYENPQFLSSDPIQIPHRYSKKEDIEIELKDRHLLVTGTRYAIVRPESEKVMRQERRFGQFQRVFSLPEAISEQNISAKFEDGVLEITIPKMEVASRKIRIL